MTRMRGNGDGTVSKRCTGECGRDTDDRCVQHKGKWQMAIHDIDGKRRFSYFSTERDAKAALRAAQKGRDAGQSVKPERHTMAELFDAWLDNLKAQVDHGEKSLNTWRQYESVVRMHLKPDLGAVESRRLTVQQVEEYLAALSLSPKTRTAHRIALRRALNVARRWGWVDRNVVQDTEPIVLPKRDISALDHGAANKLLDTLRNDRLWTVYATALHTGLRAGELAGLTIEHVDLGVRTVRICQQVQRVPRLGLSIRGLKTSASNAVLPLSTEAATTLREAIGERTSGFVWQTKSGRPYDPVYFTHKFQAALQAAGLPIVPFHRLRHYFVSLLPTLDVPVSSAQKLARHASSKTTLDVYTSVSDVQLRQAVDKLGRVLSGVSNAADVRVDVRKASLREASQSQA